MSDFRIVIGDTILTTYSSNREDAERAMHSIIQAVTEGRIYVEEKTEVWNRLPT